MADLLGRKGNFCLLKGAQGVINTIVTEGESGTSQIFAIDGPKNNTLYVFKEISSGIYTSVPTAPTGDYNFKVTMYKSTGFTGTLDSLVSLASSAASEPPVFITVKYDNPDFDITDDYTTIHLHFWYDGINYCCHVDGYV